MEPQTDSEARPRSGHLMEWWIWVRAQPWRPALNVALFTLTFAMTGLALLLVAVALGYTRDGPYLDWNAVTAAATVAGALATAATLGVLSLTLPEIEQGLADSRADRSPYIRLDISPTIPHHLPEFHPGAPYYHRTDGFVDFCALGDEPLRVSAWLRNYQSHSLGFAVDVTATFVLERLDDLSDDIAISEVVVPFVEHGKSVKLDLFQFPRTWQVRVSLARLYYTDLRNRPYERLLDAEDEIMHGRFECLWDGTRFTAPPDAIRPSRPLRRRR